MLIKLSKLSKVQLFALMWGSTVLLGYADYITGWEIPFTFLYLIPVMAITWFAGGYSGVITALFCTLVSLSTDLLWDIPYSHHTIPYWNALSRCMMLLVIAWLLVVIKNHLNKLKEAVEERTSLLTQEIEEHKLTEKELRLTEFTVENLTDAIYWITMDGRFWKTNDTGCNRLGYTRQELLSMAVPEINPDLPDDLWPAQIGKLRKEKHLRFEAVHKRKDGSTFPVEVTSNYLVYDGTEYNCAVVRDITCHKEIEAERENLMVQLSHAQRIESIGRLAGGIAHDFNNLLTPIIGYAELLRSKMQQDNSNIEKADRILEAADKAKVLTQQLLGYSRKQKLEIKTVDLNGIVSSFYEILRRTIRESIDINLNLAQEILAIHVDKNQLDQIIMNLTINAQDAIEGNGIIIMETAHVLIDEAFAAKQHFIVIPGRYNVLRITDSGSGMDQATLAHVFEPFFTTKVEGKGTGLGLAMVYGLVKQHEGFIIVDSELGKGSTFNIYFPLANNLPLHEPKAETAKTQFTANGCAVMLVEDNSLVRNLVRDLLTDLGIDVIEASSPEQALQLANGRQIDLLLTDIVMPVMAGPELYRKISEVYPAIRVLYMSGYADKSILNTDTGENANFIQKPFNVDELTVKIQSILTTAP